MLETRVVPTYSFSFAANVATVQQTANVGNAGDNLFIVQGPAGLEHSTDGVTFSSVWTGGTPPNTAAVTVNINEATGAIGNTVTIGTPERDSAGLAVQLDPGQVYSQRRANVLQPDARRLDGGGSRDLLLQRTELQRPQQLHPDDQ